MEVLAQELAGTWSPPSPEFEVAFPRLSNLLRLSRVTRITIDAPSFAKRGWDSSRQSFDLHGWARADGRTSGWLCPLSGRKRNKELHADHLLLLSGLGGITERWNEPEDTWLLNLDSALVESEARDAVGWEESYRFSCELEKMAPYVVAEEYTAFAFEANGDCTAYHKITSAAVMYAHDHSFDHITPMPDCPEYTWYEIDGCPNFVIWVETAAPQWLAEIDT